MSNYLEDAIEKMKEPFTIGPELKVTKIHQETIKRIGQTACRFCDDLIDLNYRTKQSIQPEEYFIVCKAMGAVNATAAVLDHDLMLKAFIKLSPISSETLTPLKWKNQPSLMKDWLQHMANLIRNEIPVHCYVTSHFELSIGWDIITGEFLFKMCDTWTSNDTYMSSKDGRCFHIGSQGNRIYSNHKLVSYGWYE